MQVPLKGKASVLAREVPLQINATQEKSLWKTARPVRLQGKGTAFARYGVCFDGKGKCLCNPSKQSAFAMKGTCLCKTR
jgi:hypothetical protein